MPRILCLPGFGTNQKIMKYQLRMFAKELPNFEFVIMDPFYDLDKSLYKIRYPFLSLLPEEEKIYGWTPFNQPSFKEIPITLKKFVDYINETGPYDGMLGFSQGGRLIHLFITELEKGTIKYNFKHPKFYIFICGYTSYELTEINFELKTSEAKTIHLLGTKDDLFSASYFMTLKYINPLVLFFNQPHKIPYIDSESYKKIKRFITSEMTNEANGKNNKMKAKL